LEQGLEDTARGTVQMSVRPFIDFNLFIQRIEEVL
jgi:hypothetical protein